MAELRHRGRGIRESGAFLLGPASNRRISKIFYFDDIDPHSLDTGIVKLDGRAMIPVWAYCREQEMRIYADIHTHPGVSVSQSGSDEAHPLVRRQGHTAIIVPNLAKKTYLTTRGCGIYEYLGDHKWRTCASEERRIKLSLW